MKDRYRLICRKHRGGVFYCVDKTTGKRTGLDTTDAVEAQNLDRPSRWLYASWMSHSPQKKKRRAQMLGLGLDSDGHKRFTKGDNFTLVGGTRETHEQMTEKAIKINEKLKARGKHLDNVSREELDDIAHEVGLKKAESRHPGR